jgi:hypothetical protein
VPLPFDTNTSSTLIPPDRDWTLAQIPSGGRQVVSRCGHLGRPPPDRRRRLRGTQPELTHSAITCRWTSRQNFPRRIVPDDRFTAANSELALAQPGHQPSLGPQLDRSLERRLQFGPLPFRQPSVCFVQSTARNAGPKPRRCWRSRPGVGQNGSFCLIGLAFPLNGLLMCRRRGNSSRSIPFGMTTSMGGTRSSPHIEQESGGSVK